MKTMKKHQLLASLALVGGILAGCGTLQTAGPVNAEPMKTGVQRHVSLVELKPGREEACKKHFAEMPPKVSARLRAADIRNFTAYLTVIAEKPFLVTYCEYAGHDFADDIAELEADANVQAWRKAGRELSADEKAGAWTDVEEVFFTNGAADVTPVPGKYLRIGMITGLRAEKEAEYRTLHATTWPGVLAGIKDCNYRNFTIRLAEVDGKLYLLGYLEYVGKDSAADGAYGESLLVNKRWWKYTDACQFPLPASPKGKNWAGMTEIYHQD